MLEIRHLGIQNTGNTQKAYNQIYADEGILLRDSFYLWLISLLKPKPDRLLVDISCGEGRLASFAYEKGLRSIGLDFSATGVLQGKKYQPMAGWGIADGEQLPIATASVDYVTHIGSLEHYINPYLGAGEVARILKPTGLACILLPNAYGLLGNIRYVMRTGDIFDDGQPLQRYATRCIWEDVLIQGGLKINKVIGYGEVEVPKTAKDGFWMLRRPQKILRGLIAYLTPINLANHFVFICSPKK